MTKTGPDMQIAKCAPVIGWKHTQTVEKDIPLASERRLHRKPIKWSRHCEQDVSSAQFAKEALGSVTENIRQEN